MRVSIVLSMAVLLGAASISAQQAAAPAQSGAQAQLPTGNADNGRKLFTSYGCYQCHGFEGQGSSATGPRLAPRPLPLQVFMRIVRRPPNQMPPYGPKIVSDQDIADIHAYLAGRPAPPPVASIPLLTK
jgi:mono/diheme cytochrome c family protein